MDEESLKNRLYDFLESALKELSMMENTHLTITFSVSLTPLSNDFNMNINTLLQSAETSLKNAKSLVEQNPIKILSFKSESIKQTIKEVIIVESDPSISTILEAHLKKVGLSVSSKNNGSSTIAYLMDKTDSHDILILAERLLPDMDGLEIAKELHKFPGKPKLIFLTTLSAEKDVLEGLKAGAIDYISKPFNIQLLVRKCQTALNI